MKSKKETSSKAKAVKNNEVVSNETEKMYAAAADEPDTIIKTSAELKASLIRLRDRMEDGQVPAIYACTAINQIMNLPNIYELMDETAKEIAQDIWLRIKQSGVQAQSPGMLFPAA